MTFNLDILDIDRSKTLAVGLPAFNQSVSYQRGDFMQPTVAVFGILRFPPEQIAEIRPHIRQLVETTYRNDGCIAYDVAEDPFDPGLIRFSELWPNHESLAKHLQAPHIESWRSAARSCGLFERKFTAYDIIGSREV